MTKYIALAAGALLAATLSTGAIAADPKANPSADKAKEASAATVSGERRYCVEDTVTGSRIRQRLCKTRAEWLQEGFDPLNP